MTLLYSSASTEKAHTSEISVRGWLAMATGLNLALAVCMLTCKPPWPHGLPWPGRFRTAALYIVLSCAAGALGNWIAMPRRHSGELGILLRGALRGWVFLPSVALLLQRQSLLAQVIASAAAVLMALYIFPFTQQGSYSTLEGAEQQRPALFTVEVQIRPSSWVPFAISVLWGIAIGAAMAGRMMIATLCLATAVYLLALQVATALKRVQPAASANGREDRPYIVITAAFLCVLLGLSNPAVLHSSLFTGIGRFSIPKVPKIMAREATTSGYHTIVLWPLEKEKKTILRLPVKNSAHAPGISEPLIIPFYGPYWYFKFEGEVPGRDARSTKGDPLKVKVRSTDQLPLRMEAHQTLLEPIKTSSCGEMQVVITNDADQGALAIGLVLGDSNSKKSSTLNLGLKSSPNGQSGQVEQTFTFALPKQSVLEQFNEITVTFMADARHTTSGRKVAVERFILVPR